MENKRIPFDDEELKLALEKGAIHDKSLDPIHIEEVARDIFCEDGYVRRNRHQELITNNYHGLDLIKHGFHHFITDLKLLTEFFREAVQTVQTTTTKRNRTNRIFMMGCGPAQNIRCFAQNGNYGR